MGFWLDGDDAIYGDAGDDVIGGSDGNDLVDGGDGNDDLYGGLGEDTLDGAAGNDILDDVKEANGLSGHDWFYGGDGDDRLITGSLMKALTMGIFDGGSGFDRLELATTGAIKNIGGLAQVTEGIEAIGLGYAWDATLVVNPKDVLDFSDSHVLYVTGGHDAATPIDCAVDSSTGGWQVVGTVQAFNNEFWHYQSTVNGQQVDLYVDSWLPQLGLVV